MGRVPPESMLGPWNNQDQPKAAISDLFLAQCSIVAIIQTQSPSVPLLWGCMVQFPVCWCQKQYQSLCRLNSTEQQ